MFADKIGESCLTTGTSTFQMGGAYNAFRTWRTGFGSADLAFYLATNDAGTIWEIGYGTFTQGTPDTLSRTVIASSSGAPINWVTTPYRIYSVPTAAALKHMLAPLANGTRPAWLPAGALWIDYALGLATTWVKKRFLGGGVDAEEGRFYISPAIFVPSSRSLWVDIGAAGYALTADDGGKVFAFDTTAGARTLTLLAGASFGHGKSCSVIGYGGTNGVTLTPNGSEKVDAGAAAASLTIPPNCLTRLSWDGVKLQWRTDYAVQVIGDHLRGLGTSNNSSTPNTKIDVAAGVCADSASVAMMTVAAGTIDCGTVGANGLDAGALANSTSYHVFAIGKTDGTTALLASTSATAPTLPSGYTLKRRLWSFKTDGSAHIGPYLQNGDRCTIASAGDYVAGGTSAMALRTLASVPTGIVVDVLGTAAVGSGGGTSTTMQFAPAGLATAAHTVSATDNSVAFGMTVPVLPVPSNTSAQINIAVTAFNGVATFATCGWIDRRGRDA